MGYIYGTGINQADLVDLLSSLNTNYAALLAKLDADAQITATDYASACSAALPSTVQTTGTKAISDMGVVIKWLGDLQVAFDAMLAKLDADALGTMDDNYASTLAITDLIGSYAKSGVQDQAWDQGSLVKLLDTWVTNWNALLTKLDTDPLGDSDYSSTLAITDTVDATGCFLNPLAAS